MNNKLTTIFVTILLFAVFIAEPAQAAPLFQNLIDKGIEVFIGMRDIIYVVSGFGIVGVALGGFFGNINWKWLGAIIIGLMVIASTAALIQYITGEEIGDNIDTLK